MVILNRKKITKTKHKHQMKKESMSNHEHLFCNEISFPHPSTDLESLSKTAIFLVGCPILGFQHQGQHHKLHVSIDIRPSKNESSSAEWIVSPDLIDTRKIQRTETAGRKLEEKDDVLQTYVA